MKTNTFSRLEGRSLTIAVIAARFNHACTDALLADCLEGLLACGVLAKNTRVLRVPGSFELPVVASRLVAKKKFDIIISLGVIVKGETRHDQFIASAITDGLMQLAVKTGIPMILGVVTAENMEQAEARCVGKKKRGYEAAMSAVEMGLLMV